MTSLFDLLPASPWSPRPFPFVQSPFPVSADRKPSLPALHELSPQRPPFALGSTVWPDPDESPETLPNIVASPAGDVSPFGGILGSLFGSPKDNASSSTNQLGPQYGVIQKNFPAEHRPPPPVSDWQRPESEFTVPLGSSRAQALIQGSLAAGLPADKIVLNDPTARTRRDNARIADLLLPGSGNFVSGDWGNVTERDIINLALSLATTFVPPGRIAGPARAIAGAARAAGEAKAAGAVARAAAGRGASARAMTPVLGEADAAVPALNAPQLAGQYHHGVSKRIHRALEDSMNTRGHFQHRDSRFVTQAIDKDGHRGYQQWHRQLDSEIAQHVQNTPGITPEEFEEFLRMRYRQPALLARFPNGL
jgi:hypothetical protein